MIVLLKISLAVFLAGNLFEMGLRLNPHDALRGLRDFRFVALILIWGFLLGPALAYGITRVVPLAEPYAAGLILIGLTPCAPFLPMLAAKARGDLGYTAAIMLVTSVGTLLTMPFVLPLMVKGLTVSAWTIAKPLLTMILIPLAIGMAVRLASLRLATAVQPAVKTIARIATVAVLILCLIVYGKGLLGVPGSFAIAAQVLFFFPVTYFTYRFGWGMPHDRKIVLCMGMATRNIGAAIAPLFAIKDIDQRAVIMVVLGLPLMVIASLLASKRFAPPSLNEVNN